MSHDWLTPLIGVLERSIEQGKESLGEPEDVQESESR